MNSKLIEAGSADGAAIAAKILRGEGIIIHPTETVYGFAANAFSLMAIRRVELAKRRKSKDSFILLVKDIDMACSLGVKFDKTAEKLAARFWPGPLTMVLPVSKTQKLNHLCHNNSLAIRVSPDPFVVSLFSLIDFPIISTSANVSGEAVLKTPEKLLEVFENNVDMVFGRGLIHAGKPSTIIAVYDNEVSIIREGVIQGKEIYVV